MKSTKKKKPVQIPEVKLKTLPFAEDEAEIA